ncbi:MAG: TIGR02186 family protein [Proteobacteria bacterium]|nr:TIGR02186 family protein [Pseudomonadota bacterium]
MRQPGATLALTIAMIAGATASARAERLVVSLSNHRVAVTSNFVGTEIVLFGTVEPDSPRTALRGGYDIVTTVSGPTVTLRTRRKERVLGIWVNVDSREFIRVPSYLGVLSNRPIQQIADVTTARNLQLGLNHIILTQRIGTDFADTVTDDPFRLNFINLQKEAEQYRDVSNGVTFLTPTVFRVSIPLPANVPTGTYTVDVKLFSGGQMIARTNTALEVIKSGFEQYVFEASQNHGLIYGLVTATMALMIGWFATVVFKRD